MKEVYLAYFDYLGFKEFIEKNENEILIRRMGHIFRDIENALGQGKFQQPQKGVILSDLSHSKVNCLNISDTVLFWTNQCDFESLKELIKVAYDFNWRQNLYNFPVRGSIIKGEIRLVSGKQTNSNGGSYSVQCLYGKGLIKAHNKAEFQNWAGTVIDKTIISDLQKEQSGIEFLSDYAIKYQVPYKTDTNLDKEYVLKIVKGIKNKAALENAKENILDVFSLDNKSTNIQSVQLKIQNTLSFIEFLAK